MCYVAIIAKVAEVGDPLVEGVIKVALHDKAVTNDDGFGFIKLVENDFKICKTMEMSEANKLLDDVVMNDFAGVHFRIATHGAKNIGNVHWWRSGKWAFAHNGTVWGEGRKSYFGTSSLQAEKADSLEFFEKLLDSLNRNKKDFPKRIAQILRDNVDRHGLYGRGFLIDLEKQLVYGFGDLQAYLLNGSYMVICSADTDWDCIDYTTFGDLFFQKEQTGAVEVLHSKIEGGWVWNIRTKKMKVLETHEWVDKTEEKKDETKDKEEENKKLPLPADHLLSDKDENWKRYQDEQEEILDSDYGSNTRIWDYDDQELFSTAYKVNSFLSRGFEKRANYYKGKIKP